MAEDVATPTPPTIATPPAAMPAPAAPVPYYQTAPFVVSMAFTPLVYVTVCAVLFKDSFSQDLKTFVVTSVLNLIAGAIMGFFLGAAFSQQASKRSTDPGVTNNETKP